MPPMTPCTAASNDPRSPAARTSALLLVPGLLLFGAIWLVHLDYASLTPPADNIEQLTWVNSLELGYNKHPPLPTWLLWLPVRLFGRSAWTSYVMGAATTLASMGLLWHLMTRLRGHRHATIALLATLCVTFYNGRLHYYNHNVVMMFFVTAAAALNWQAFTSRKLRWWAALGLCLGLGALAKYQMVLAMVATVVFWAEQRGWRVPEQRRGLLLAALLALLVVAPHLRWLVDNDFAPIRYALNSSLGAGLDLLSRMAGAAHWLLDQLFNRTLPAWLLLGLLAARAIYWRPARADAPPLPLPAADASGKLLVCWGVLPLLLITAAGVVSGAELQLHWATAFLPLTVAAAMEPAVLRALWPRVPLPFALKVFVALQGLLLLLSHLTSPHGPARLQKQHWRNFDSAALARQIAPPARDLLGRRIRVVIGPAAHAGALSLQLPEHPVVLIDGRYDLSPWVEKNLVERCGALELRIGAHGDDFRPVGNGFADLSWRVVMPTGKAGSCSD